MSRDVALILGASKGLGKAITAECRRREWRTIEVARFRDGGTPEQDRATAILRAQKLGLSVMPTAPAVMPEGRATIAVGLEDAANAGRIIPILCDYRDRGWIVTRFFWVAGAWWEGPFEVMDRTRLLELVDVNLRNALPVCHHVWSEFVWSAEPRSFVAIGSTSGIVPKSNQAIYSATKFAQVGFTRELGLEAQRLRQGGRVRGRIPGEHYTPGIRVALFNPGGMRTHLFDAKPPANYAEFMDPAKVASHIVAAVAKQRDPYLEQEITRDSALGQSLR